MNVPSQPPTTVTTMQSAKILPGHSLAPVWQATQEAEQAVSMLMNARSGLIDAIPMHSALIQRDLTLALAIMATLETGLAAQILTSVP